MDNQPTQEPTQTSHSDAALGQSWWGYVHVNGSIQAKRYFSAMDVFEARMSPFVAVVVGPFEANGRAEALRRVMELAGE